jgi:hypothetical protein|nr:hypothetical protein [uncultured Romboutsia sp.]
MNTKVISGFPGVGKSYLFNNTDLKVLDSDSSNFSWIKDSEGRNTKERNPDFPQNYIDHIKKNIGKVDIILTSSHDVVRKALKESCIDYILVHPNIRAKEEYIERYTQRGNDESFIKMINENWDKFIIDIENENFPIKIELDKFEYLSDLIKYGYCKNGNIVGSNYISRNLYSWRGCPIQCNDCDYCIRVVK